jgi:4-hydroxyphenylpyruvate dioxygenase-like putative hemolysin
MASRLAADAADAVGAYDIDHVSHLEHAGHMPDGFLDELLQVERRQLSAQKESASLVLDRDIVDPSTEMRMSLKVIAGE